MADITGRIYEAFTEFILRRLGYRDEWTEGEGRQYLYEKHVNALCHKSVGICSHAQECDTYSQKFGIPHGPWYDPDFVILDNNKPVACFHITHWSNPGSSQYKFWRTIEDHFQYKIFFGFHFLSLNLVFDALDESDLPQVVVNSEALVTLHGWKPAIGSIYAVSFDATILFPKKYFLLEKFILQLPAKIPKPPQKRRELYNRVWNKLYEEYSDLCMEVDAVTMMFRNILNGLPNPLYNSAVIEHLQDVCYNGRQCAVNVRHTETRYRRGIQHAFILREMLARQWHASVNPDDALWQVLQHNPRFPRSSFEAIFGLPANTSEDVKNFFESLLVSIPVAIDKGIMQPLLIPDAGLDHVTWNLDFTQFILGLRNVPQADMFAFRQALDQLFDKYRNAYGMEYVLADLYDSDRIRRKVEYIAENYIGVDETTFVQGLTYPFRMGR